MIPFRFNFIDIFRAPRLALSAKKIWVQLRALVLATIIYNAGAYLALWLSGEDVYAAWSTYYLFPTAALARPGVLGPVGYVCWASGTAGFLVAVLLGMTAVAKVTAEQLRGNDFYSRREAEQFVRRHWRAVVFTPIAVAICLAFLTGGGLLVGLIGKIPWFGDIFAALTFFPLFLIGLLFIVLLFVFALSFYLTPAVVGTTADDTFETSFELYAVTTAQPWRLVVYEILALALTVIGTAVFAAFAVAAAKLAFLALYLPMGDKAAVAFAAAARVLPPCLKGACGVGAHINIAALACSTGAPPTFTLPLAWPQALAATFISAGLLLAYGVVCAYGLNVHTASQTIIYIILRKKKDDENLLELYDDELEQALVTAPEEKNKTNEGSEGTPTPKDKP